MGRQIIIRVLVACALLSTCIQDFDTDGFSQSVHGGNSDSWDRVHTPVFCPANDTGHYYDLETATPYTLQ